MADLALVTQFDQGSQRVLERDLRVDGVQLQQVDPLDAEPMPVSANPRNSSNLFLGNALRPIDACRGPPDLGRAVARRAAASAAWIAPWGRLAETASRR